MQQVKKSNLRKRRWNKTWRVQISENIPSISKNSLKQVTACENSGVSSLTWFSTILKHIGCLSRIPSSNAADSKNPSL